MQATLFKTTRFEKFLKFYRENPQVYELFYEMASRAIRSSHNRIGGRLIWERLRWELVVEVKATETPKLNDHHVPYYTRLIMGRHPATFSSKFVTKDKNFDTTTSELVKQCDKIDQQRSEA